jgi:hypothetical protein
MKPTLFAILIIVGIVAVAPRGSTADPMTPAPVPMGYDDDDDEEEWKCKCSVTCDDVKFTTSERVCADDEDLKEAMQDAVDECYREADPKCDEEPSCKCTCKATGNDC